MRLAVIAMGRLGGSEVGYGSDADVLFVHEPYAPDGQPMPDGFGRPLSAAHEVAETMRRLLAVPGPDPPLVVDAGLRPEGKQGPLTRSIASYATYYERWSLGWEAQALLRARPIVGDQDVGLRFTALADEIRYPGSLPREEVSEVLRLRGRMERERVPRGVDRSLHLKLGPGGLTDVEWAAQLLQLRYGVDGAEPAHDRDASGARRRGRRRPAVGRGRGDVAHSVVGGRARAQRRRAHHRPRLRRAAFARAGRSPRSRACSATGRTARRCWPNTASAGGAPAWSPQRSFVGSASDPPEPARCEPVAAPRRGPRPSRSPPTGAGSRCAGSGRRQ